MLFLGQKRQSRRNMSSSCLNIELPSDQGSAPSHFDDGASGWSVRFPIPLLSDFEEVVRKQFQTPLGAGRGSRVRCHLWLSQSMLQPEDRACLLRLLVEPLAMFGPDATNVLEQAQEARRCASEVSGTLRWSQEWHQPQPHQLKQPQPT